MTRTTTDSDQRTSKSAGGNTHFSTLDEERQASMADEGGVSGALMEVDGEERATLRDDARRRRFGLSWKLALGFVVLGLAVALVARTYPSR